MESGNLTNGVIGIGRATSEVLAQYGPTLSIGFGRNTKETTGYCTQRLQRDYSPTLWSMASFSLEVRAATALLRSRETSNNWVFFQPSRSAGNTNKRHYRSV